MKFLYLFLFIVSLLFSLIFSPIAIDALPSLLFSFLSFSLFFFLVILFFLLYTKAKNKHLPESEKTYKGLKVFGKILYICFLVSAVYAGVSFVTEIHNLRKYYDIYTYLYSSPYEHLLTNFLSHLFLAAVFLASSWVVAHFLKKWEAPSSTENNQEE